MTVTELIAELRKLPPDAPVYVWDGDNDRWTSADEVWLGATPIRTGSTLPAGAVAVSG